MDEVPHWILVETSCAISFEKFAESLFNFVSSSFLFFLLVEKIMLFHAAPQYMDKSWISTRKTSHDFVEGFSNFLKFACENSAVNGKIICPCRTCSCRYYKTRLEVETHVMRFGFCRDYTVWVHHGERTDKPSAPSSSEATPLTLPLPNLMGENGTRGSIRCASRGHLNQTVANDHANKTVAIREELLVDAHLQLQNGMYGVSEEEMIDDASDKLYPGCLKYSKLSFTLHLLYLKYMFRWSKKSFTMLLELLVHAFPQMAPFPTTFAEAEKLMKGLGLGCEKIHICPNGCMLYWDSALGKSIKDERCKICGLSRWREGSFKGQKKKPAKVIRYFPVIPRLKRFYMSTTTAIDMVWHAKQRPRDGKLKHPADGLAWKSFDEKHPNFAADPRNIRLGLSSYEFNTFQTTGTWLVVLYPYNFPPSLCMEMVLVSMIIPGKEGPSNNYNVYLEPLIAELCELWKGVEAYDVCSGEKFSLKAALMWTVNNFSEYSNLSGWNTKGEYACPFCGKYTDSIWLKHERKFCYMGHRKWLSRDHPYRFEALQFDGTIETRSAPNRDKEVEVRMEVTCQDDREIWNVAPEGDHINGDCLNRLLWKKKSIFNELPYWKHQLLRYNLDVMDIERSVTESLVSLFLKFDEKSIDNENLRKDLVALNMKHNLHPVSQSDGRKTYPPAVYTMSEVEKVQFLNILKELKGHGKHGSNISRCVNVEERKLMNMKNYDYHVLIQNFLPMALRSSMNSEIVYIVTQLSAYFKDIFANDIDLKEIVILESVIADLLCRMEKVFPPSFFTIMVHLLIHLPEEIKHGGPSPYRCLYSVERLLGELKSNVRDEAHLDACITNNMVAEECLTYCSEYLGAVDTVFIKPVQNDDSCVVHVSDHKSLTRAHRYVLFHLDLIETFRKNFLRSKRGRGRPNQTSVANLLSESFVGWFEEEISRCPNTIENYKLLKILARGPDSKVKKLRDFVTPGCKFEVDSDDEHPASQHAGVTRIEGGKTCRYGKIKDIFELDYSGECKVVLFSVMWVDVDKGMRRGKNGVTMVNFSHLVHTGEQMKDEPFVLPSEVDRVYFSADENEPQWYQVLKRKPKEPLQNGHNLLEGEMESGNEW